MTTGKKKSRRKTRKSSRPAGKRPTVGSNLKKVLIGFVVLIVTVAIGGILAHLLIDSRPAHSPVKTARNRSVPEITHHKTPVHKKARPKVPATVSPASEKSPEEKKKNPLPTAVSRRRTQTAYLPKVAIIIDDLGYDTRISDKLLSLDVPLTFALLPGGSHRVAIAENAHRKGIELMLHLPMEPLEYPRVDPGPGALLTRMSPDELLHQLEINLDAVPHIEGVNNHMGSKMTAISTQMYQIFSILKGRHLYFVDSRTTSRTLCKPSARLLQLPFAERDIFLDHVQSKKFIRKQLKKLVRAAEQNGQAIGIGHPHPVTYEVLRSELPKISSRIRFVTVSQVIQNKG